MQSYSASLDLFAVIILLGVIQGLFLSFFFLNRKIRRRSSNLYLGLVMLALSLIILEIFLNHTGYMYKVLWIDNFSEPLSFAVPPLMYFYIYSTIRGNSPKHTWLHLIPFFFWALYCIFYFIQPLELKQLHYLDYHNPEMQISLPDVPYREDPLGLRTYVNELVMLQFIAYLFASILLIRNTFRTLGKPFFASGIKPVSWLRSFIFLMFAILLTLVAVKFLFEADLGDFIIGSLISVVIYATSFNVIRQSDFFQDKAPSSIQEQRKYAKSALLEEDKNRILSRLKECMEADQDFKNPLVSQPFISRKLGIPVHHISQVINEKLGQSFFEMIASYRIEEAKKLLKDPDHSRLTIEDLADEVGYNSKSAFNRSFKKHTGLTPSAFRSALGDS
jgi:AraC-like DNA-binding protein